MFYKNVIIRNFFKLILKLLRGNYIRSAVARVLSLSSQFILIFFASRAALPETFGEFTTLLSAALFAGVYFSMGQIGATYKVLPKLFAENSKNELSNELSKLISLVIWFIPILAIILFIIIYYGFGLRSLAGYIVICGIIMALLELISVVLRSYSFVFLSDFCKNSMWRLAFIVMTIMLMASKDPTQFTYLNITFLIALLICLGVSIGVCQNITKPKLDIVSLRRTALKLIDDVQRWLISVSNTVFSSLDVVAVGIMVGFAEAGLYFILARMASIPGLILSITNPVIVPVISRIAQGEHTQLLKNLVKRNTMINVLTTSLLCVFIYCFRFPIFNILAGYDAEITLVLVLLIIGQMVNAFVGPTVLSSQIFDIQKETVCLIGVSLLVFLIGVYGFVPHFGITAMAATVLLIRALQNIGIAIILRFKSGFSILTGEVNRTRFKGL